MVTGAYALDSSSADRSTHALQSRATRSTDPPCGRRLAARPSLALVTAGCRPLGQVRREGMPGAVLEQPTWKRHSTRVEMTCDLGKVTFGDGQVPGSGVTVFEA